MRKPAGHLSTEIPGANPIQWGKLNEGDLAAFVLEVLGTLGKDGTAVWYPLTAYTLRMVQAARWRLWRQGGCGLRVRTDVENDRLYVRTDFSSARAFNAWTRISKTRGAAGTRTLRVLAGGRARRKRAA